MSSRKWWGGVNGVGLFILCGGVGQMYVYSTYESINQKLISIESSFLYRFNQLHFEIFKTEWRSSTAVQISINN